MSRPITATMLARARLAGGHARRCRTHGAFRRTAQPPGALVARPSAARRRARPRRLRVVQLPQSVRDARKAPRASPASSACRAARSPWKLPRIAGVTRDSRAYELTAETAVQDIAKPDVVELQNLRAKMELQDADVVVITAKSGTYNTKGDSVVLREHVVVTSAQRLQREAARGHGRHEEGQRAVRRAGRDQAAEREPDGERDGDRRFRRRRAFHATASCSISMPSAEAKQ